MPSILIVDDDPSILEMLKENFHAEGYAVLAAYDGQMALRMARESRPNLIIMDVNMPMLNGLKALEYLRNLQDTKNIPIIFLTGEASASVFPSLETVPRVAHQKKPIDLDHLNSLVREFLSIYPI